MFSPGVAFGLQEAVLLVVLAPASLREAAQVGHVIASSDRRVTHVQNGSARLPLQLLLPPRAETRQPALAAEEE